MKTIVIDLYCLNPWAWLKYICAKARLIACCCISQFKESVSLVVTFRANAVLQYCEVLNQFCFGSGTVILYLRCFTFPPSMIHEP